MLCLPGNIDTGPAAPFWDHYAFPFWDHCALPFGDNMRHADEKISRDMPHKTQIPRLNFIQNFRRVRTKEAMKTQGAVRSNLDSDQTCEFLQAFEQGRRLDKSVGEVSRSRFSNSKNY